MHADYDCEFPAIDDKILDKQQILNEFYQKLASEQKDTTPEFEKTFRKHFRRLLSKTK